MRSSEGKVVGDSLTFCAMELANHFQTRRRFDAGGAFRWPGATAEKAPPLQVRKDLHVYSTLDRKNPKVRKDLNILRAVPVLLIKVLTDLKKLRAAFIYRHLGPHGPKEVPAAAS